jgi:plastocyanin
MSRFSNRYIGAIALAAVLPCARASTQPAPAVAAHLVVIKLVEDAKSAHPYAFVPTTVTVARGDTVRFLQVANTPHDVRFTKIPSGAKIGRSTSPMLIARGDKYELVIDARFPAGVYAFVCDPHEALGMKGTLTVVPGP